MEAHVAKTLTDLERKLKALEIAYENDRAVLLATIAGLKQLAGTTPEAAQTNTMAKGTQSSQKKRTASPKSAAGPLGKRGAVAKLLLEAVKAQTSVFSKLEIRAYLDTRHPAESASISDNRISREIYALREQRNPPVVVFDKKDTKGGRHTYRYNHPS